MNSELLTLNLQDLETLFTKSNCSCHFINPNKTRIILWKEVKDSVTTHYLRVGIQKFISYPLTDKNNETYWRFKPWEREVEVKVTNDPNPITKFQQRQAQAQNGKPNNTEQSVNNSATS